MRISSSKARVRARHTLRKGTTSSGLAALPFAACAAAAAATRVAMTTSADAFDFFLLVRRMTSSTLPCTANVVRSCSDV